MVKAIFFLQKNFTSQLLGQLFGQINSQFNCQVNYVIQKKSQVNCYVNYVTKKFLKSKVKSIIWYEITQYFVNYCDLLVDFG